MRLLIAADLAPTSVTEKHFEEGNTRALFGDICYLAPQMDRFIVNLECALTNHDGARGGTNSASRPRWHTITERLKTQAWMRRAHIALPTISTARRTQMFGASFIPPGI